MNTNTKKRPKVVVVGAGFGGLSVAKTLGNRGIDVLLLDRNNYHGFWPLLYQVATGGMESASIAYPIRSFTRPYKNVDFQMAAVTGVNWDAKQVLVEDGAPVDYDYLILAAGSAQFYFGNDVLADKTFSMKDVDEAEQIRNHVLQAFEKAQTETDPQKQQELMTVAIVGGGPTGVELAGAYSELFKNDFARDFKRSDATKARVVLIEAMDAILTPFSLAPELQSAAQAMLERRGVEVMLNKPVEAVEDNIVKFKDGEVLAAGTVIWAAGVRGATLGDSLGIKLQRGYRVPVSEFLNLPDKPDVFVIGDMAYLEGYPWGDKKIAFPMVAQVAIQMGEQASHNILRMASGGEMAPFKYFDKGSMAIVGRNSAIMAGNKPFPVKLGANRLTQFPAWLAWLAVHLLFLQGNRNRLVASANWAWNWFSKGRGSRVVTGKRDTKTDKMAAHS